MSDANDKEPAAAALLKYETSLFGMEPNKWHFLTEADERKAVLCFMDAEYDPFRIVHLPGDDTATLETLGQTYFLFNADLLEWLKVMVDEVVDEVDRWIAGDDCDPEITAAWGDYVADEDGGGDPDPIPST